MPEFSHSTEIDVRYNDTDAMGHVNNATYVTYLEVARSDYYDAVIGDFPKSVETVVAKLIIEYRNEIRYEDAVTVDVRIVDLGETSFEMSYEMKTDIGTVATGCTIIVVVDSETGDSRPIPDEWRRHICQFERLE